MIVALDACTIIYLMEGGSSIGELSRSRFRELLRDPAGRAVCSQLARLKCCVGPLRAGDATLGRALGDGGTDVDDADPAPAEERIVAAESTCVPATDSRRPTPFISPPRTKRAPICSSPGTPIRDVAPK